MSAVPPQPHVCMIFVSLVLKKVIIFSSCEPTDIIIKLYCLKVKNFLANSTKIIYNIVAGVLKMLAEIYLEMGVL